MNRILVGVATLAALGVVAFRRWNRSLEAACALPNASRSGFKRIPLPLELVYVTFGLTAALARSASRTLRGGA